MKPKWDARHIPQLDLPMAATQTVLVFEANRSQLCWVAMEKANSWMSRFDNFRIRQRTLAQEHLCCTSAQPVELAGMEIKSASSG
jgi:hypothetical protein